MDFGKIWKIFFVLLILGFVPFSASVSEVDVLVVDDGHTLSGDISYEDGMFNSTYREALNSTPGVDVELTGTVEGESGPSFETMSEYDMVVWYTLADSSKSQTGFITLTNDDRTNLKRYLDQGGALYLTGHNLDEESFLKGPGSYLRKVFNARYRDGVSSASYWRFTDQGNEGSPEDWEFKEVYDDETQNVESPYRLYFGQDGDVALKGEEGNSVTDGLAFMLNKSIEPPTTVGIFTDNCEHEPDPKIMGCTNQKADDGLRFANNLPVRGESSSSISIQNENSNSMENGYDFRVGYDRKDRGEVMISIVRLKQGNGGEIDLSENDESFRQVAEVENERFVVKTFFVENPEDEGSIQVNSGNRADIAAITFSVTEVTEVSTVSAQNTKTSDSDRISTSVDSNNGDKVIDFLASTSDVSTEGDSQNDETSVDVGGNNAQMTFKSTSGQDGEVTMPYSGGGNYAHIVLNLRRDRSDADYYVETDGYSGSGGQPVTYKGNSRDSDVESSNYPDEYAHTMVNSWDNDHRTVFNSIGFEAIQGKENREKLMNRIVRYLTGPVAYTTHLNEGSDIPNSGADESRYTDQYLNLDSRGINLQANPADITDARYSYNYSSTGLEPALQTGFETTQDFEENWNIDYNENDDGAYADITAECGVRKGDKALRLDSVQQGDGPFGTDDNDDSLNLTSDALNLTHSQDLTLEFSVFYPLNYNSEDGGTDARCNGAETDQGEDLTVYYLDPDGKWEKLDTLKNDGEKDYWDRKEYPIPDSDLHRDFKIRFFKHGSDYEDAWIIDELSLDSSVDLETRNDLETPFGYAERNFINATRINPELIDEDDPRGVNVTFGVQYKDDSQQGYWGPMEEYWVKVDTQAPYPTDDIFFSTDYTNQEVVNVTVRNSERIQYLPDLVRFSCTGDTYDWGEWRQRNRSKINQDFRVDITSWQLGCDDSQGNRTIRIQVRDYAGNLGGASVEDWIVYDTDKPSYEGEQPQNKSAVQHSDQIRLEASDNFALRSQSELRLNGTNRSFSPNSFFSPEFERDAGLRSFTAWIFDRAGNFRKVNLRYDVDDDAPRVDVTPGNSDDPKNNTAVRPSTLMDINVFDRNLDEMVVNSDVNHSFSSNRTFDPGWAEGESRDLEIWVNDTAGNKDFKNYTYTVDGTPPVLESARERNESYIQTGDLLAFNFSDAISGVDEDGYKYNEERRLGINSDIGFTPEWNTEEEHYLDIEVKDESGNILFQNFTYTVDNTPPSASLNYTREGWKGENFTVEISASDTNVVDTVFYDIFEEESLSDPSEFSQSNTVNLNVGCSQGKVCEKRIVYNVNDTAGNTLADDYKQSELISIDKKKPSIDFESPPADSTVSGIIDIEADISDDSGVKDANFSVINSTDTSQTFISGDLNASKNWTYEWNSTAAISATENVILNVTAEDEFGQREVRERSFVVENQRTTVTIQRPGPTVVPEDFSLRIEAERPGRFEGLKWHNFSVKNQSNEIVSETTDVAGGDGHVYSRQFDSSRLSGDGNYTLNTTALSGSTGEFATSEEWFYLDTTPPQLSIPGQSINNSWVTGEITVDYTAFDTVKNGSLVLKYRNSSTNWKVLDDDLGFGEGQFSFDTGDYCRDSRSESCGLKLVAEDSVGNKQSSILEFKVDNSAPVAAIESPESGSWQKNSFDVSRSVSDNLIQSTNLICQVRINSGSWSDTGPRGDCNEDFTVEIPDECGEQGSGECKVEIRAEHPYLDLESTAENFYSIDTEEPRVFNPPKTGIINGSTELSIGFSDETSGIELATWSDGNTTENLTSGEKFEPTWNRSGAKTLEVILEDVARNREIQQYGYTFDNRAPNLNEVNLSVPEDQQFNEVRVYRGEEIRLIANVSENIEMQTVKATVQKESERNVTLDLAEGNEREGLWKINLRNSSTGPYNVTKIFLRDRAGNLTVKSSGPAFRVVNYSESITFSGKNWLNAGNASNFTYEIDFNRTQGLRNPRIEVPTSSESSEGQEYFDLRNLECKANRCNVTDHGDYLNLSYNGSNSEISLEGEIEAFKPENDVSGNFTTDLKGNIRRTGAEVRVPELVINQSSCDPSCTVDQFSNFSLNYQVINNNSADNTGAARGVDLELSGAKDLEKQIGSLNSGQQSSIEFSNISFDAADNYTFEANLTDITGAYNDSDSIEVKVLDVEPPKILNISPESQRININGSIELAAEIEDNIGVTGANLTVEYPNSTMTNVTLESGSDNRWSSTFENTSKQGIYHLRDLYAVDARGNRNQTGLSQSFKVTELTANSTVQKTNLTNKESVNFTVNVTGNSTAVDNILLNVTTPSGDTEEVTYTDVGLNNTLTYGGFSNSGNYSFETVVTAGLSVGDTTRDVYVKYGNASLRSLEKRPEAIEIPEDLASVSMDWKITPVNGSLANVTLQASTQDSSIADFVVSSEDIGDISYEQDGINEGLMVTPEGLGRTNLSVSANPGSGGSDTSTLAVEVVDSDNDSPDLENLTLSEKALNLNESFDVEVEVSDNSVIKNATLVVEHPVNGSGVVERLRMDRDARGNFSYRFGNTTEVGNYSLMVKAWDVSGNSVSEQVNFTVSDDYRVEVLTDQQIYMKQEQADIDFNVYDVSGEPVEDYTIEANISRGGQNYSKVDGENVESTSYYIEESYPPSETVNPDRLPLSHNMYVKVSSEGNNGTAVENILVDRIFEVEIYPEQEYVAPGETFTIVSSWSEPINDPLPARLDGFVLCEYCPSEYKDLILDLDTGNYVQNLTAPNETGEYQFEVKGFLRGNSQSQNPDVGTDSDPFDTFRVVPEGEPPNGSEGGGGGGFPSVPGGGGGPSMEITRLSPDVSVSAETDEVNLSVNTNIAATCVYSRNSIPDQVSFSEASEFQNTGGVTHSTEVEADRSITYSYDVMCASENANATSSIVFSKGEVDVTSFRLPSFPGSLTPGNETVSQGENKTASFVVENNMSSDDLNLRFNYSSECCEGFVMRDGEVINEAEIGPQGSRQFRLGVDVPLSAEEGTYRPTILIRSENSSQPPKRRQPDFQVLNSEEISRFQELVQRSQILNSSIRRYSIAGIDTSRERELFDELVDSIQDANRSIQNDNITGLRQALDIGYRKARQIDTGLQDEAWKKYLLLNWWKWALGFVILYIMFFLVTVVGIPYYRIQTELVRIESELEDQVEARKKGEKQYFKRQIDKDTFNSMMQDRQNEILELRGEKEDLKDELDGFLWNKLTLQNYLKAPWKGMEELEKWWAANRRARENLNKDQDDEGKE